MKELQDLMDWNLEWSKRTFGITTPQAPAYHLKKEVGELIESLEANVSWNEIVAEYADCLILICNSASKFGLTAEDLMNAANKKMAINEKRKWGKPDENGVFEHIKE